MDVRLYVDLKGLEASLKEEYGEDYVLDVVSLNVYNCQSKGGEFALLVNSSANPTLNYIVVDAPRDTDWFKVSWIDTLGTESDLSDPFLCELTASFITKAATALHDTNRESDTTVAFTDEEYIRKLRQAIRKLFQRDNLPLSELTESEFEAALISVRQSCCYDLAYDTAKYYKLQLPEGMVLERNQVPEHYISLAKALGQYFDDTRDDMGIITPQSTIEELDSKSTSYFNPAKLPQNRLRVGYSRRRELGYFE